jgi:hypothetical protein
MLNNSTVVLNQSLLEFINAHFNYQPGVSMPCLVPVFVV